MFNSLKMMETPEMTMYKKLPSDTTSEKSSEVGQILLECKLTDYLQRQLERCNSKFKNFQLRLVMEE